MVGRSRVVQQVERRVFERNRSESLHKEESRRYVNSNIYSLLSNDGEHEENYERAIEETEERRYEETDVKNLETDERDERLKVRDERRAINGYGERLAINNNESDERRVEMNNEPKNERVYEKSDEDKADEKTMAAMSDQIRQKGLIMRRTQVLEGTDERELGKGKH